MQAHVGIHLTGRDLTRGQVSGRRWMIFILLATSAAGSDPGTRVQDFKPVDYCDLIRHANEYDGKAVAVKATYRYGFEWQEIYCLACGGEPKTWLEFSTDSEAKLRHAFSGTPRHQGTLNGTFYGTFQSSHGPFGDGGYQYRFNLQMATDVKFVSKSGGAPSSLPASVRAKVCGGEHESARFEHQEMHVK